MKDLSIFIDESGDAGSGSDNYLLTLVFHDQTKSISESIDRYLRCLQDAQFELEAFHFTPITRGHSPFDMMDFQTRKKRFALFRIFAEQTNFQYLTFSYKKHELNHENELESRMKRDLNAAMLDNLAFFQSFDAIKVYYDNGQRIVKRAIHAAVEETVSKEAIVYRDASPSSYFLFQVADYVCGIELTAIRYQTHKAGRTEERFFGEWVNFKRNYLRKIRKKRLG